MNAITLPHQWKPRPYQLPVWSFMENGGTRAITVWHRRAGKDLTALNLMACKSQERVGLYLHVFPQYSQARKAIWDGSDKAGKPFLNAFPPEIIQSKNDTEMKLTLANGSRYQIAGSDRIDSLMGTNPVGLIMSEYSLQDPHAWDYLRPILAENEGWVWFVYTPRGHNHGYTLFNKTQSNPKWFTQLLTVDDTKAISLEAIEDDRATGMPEEIVQQEYWCSFDAPLVGAYYAEAMGKAYKEKRIGQFPYDPMLPVSTFWDLGMDDSTAIWFAQFQQGAVRIVDYYENNGEGLVHYIKKLRELPYDYEEHWAPNDINVRDWSTGVSRYDTALAHGFRFQVAPKLAIEDGIEAVRNLLPKCYFHEYENTERGIEALKTYQKEYDEVRKIYKSKPLHDWTSHAADAFRVLGLAHKRRVIKTKARRNNLALTDYEFFT